MSAKRGKPSAPRASGARGAGKPPASRAKAGTAPKRTAPQPESLRPVRGSEGKAAPAKAVRAARLSSKAKPARSRVPASEEQAAGSAPPALHGIGVDVLRIERMEQLLQRRGQRVLTRLLCTAERREVKARTNVPRALAMCWAAKEAFVKALGCGFSAGIAWSDVGVVREANGRPTLIFSRSMQARLKAEGVGAAHVSLSDDGGQVCAYVILERAARS